MIEVHKELEVVIDPRCKLMINSHLLNMMDNLPSVATHPISASATAITAAAAAPVPISFSQPRHISLSSWMLETGKGVLALPEMSLLGKKVAVIYRARHDGNSPSKHDQYVNGKVTSVNSYTEEDFPILEAAWGAYQKEKKVK
jgi:hypothetical protein